MHLCVVLSRLSKNIHNLTYGCLEPSRKILYQNRHLHALPLFLDGIYRDLHIVWHTSVLYYHPRVFSCYLHKPDIRPGGAAYHFYDLSLIAFFNILFCYRDKDRIIVERPSHLAYRDEHIFPLVFLYARLFSLLWGQTDKSVTAGSHLKQPLNNL